MLPGLLSQLNKLLTKCAERLNSAKFPHQKRLALVDLERRSVLRVRNFSFFYVLKQARQCKNGAPKFGNARMSWINAAVKACSLHENETF